MYNGYEITFDGAGSWSFGVAFSVDNSSLSHADNARITF